MMLTVCYAIKQKRGTLHTVNAHCTSESTRKITFSAIWPISVGQHWHFYVTISLLQTFIQFLFTIYVWDLGNMSGSWSALPYELAEHLIPKLPPFAAVISSTLLCRLSTRCTWVLQHTPEQSSSVFRLCAQRHCHAGTSSEQPGGIRTDQCCWSGSKVQPFYTIQSEWKPTASSFLVSRLIGS